MVLLYILCAVVLGWNAWILKDLVTSLFSIKDGAWFACTIVFGTGVGFLSSLVFP